jgi:hypothetical protein
VISAYQVVTDHPAWSIITAAAQQYSLLIQPQDLSRAPRAAFRHEILLTGNFNECICNEPNGMQRLIKDLDLVDLMTRIHPAYHSQTHMQGDIDVLTTHLQQKQWLHQKYMRAMNWSLALFSGFVNCHIVWFAVTTLGKTRPASLTINKSPSSHCIHWNKVRISLSTQCIRASSTHISTSQPPSFRWAVGQRCTWSLLSSGTKSSPHRRSSMIRRTRNSQETGLSDSETFILSLKRVYTTRKRF